MKTRKLITATLLSFALTLPALADETKAPVMQADEIIIATQSTAGNDLIIPLFMLLFIAAALASTSSSDPILEILAE